MADAEDHFTRKVLDEWESLGVAEFEEILHLPAKIRRRKVDGKFKVDEIVLRPITNRQRFKARVGSREAALTLKLDLDRDKDLVEELEQYAQLSYAIRDGKTFDQHMPDALTLFDFYDSTTLGEVYGIWDLWCQRVDPRFGDVSPEAFWQMVVRIANEGSPHPLAGMRGSEQATCIVLMAREACSSPNKPSSAQPLGTWRLESSPSSSSPRSSE